MPLLIQSDEGYLVNTSSVNGFWASLGPGMPHTAYSAAKFAVKGFSEALLEDFRINAPHVKVAVVMPGHIGTDIVVNSRIAHGIAHPDAMTPGDIAAYREELKTLGYPMDQVDDDALRSIIKGMGEQFRRRRRSRRRRRRRSSLTACARGSGASSSATTHTSSTRRCAPTRRTPTVRTESRLPPLWVRLPVRVDAVVN